MEAPRQCGKLSLDQDFLRIPRESLQASNAIYFLLGGAAAAIGATPLNMSPT